MNPIGRQLLCLGAVWLLMLLGIVALRLGSILSVLRQILAEQRRANVSRDAERVS